MKKLYLNKLKPEEIIKRLKNGEVVKREDRGDKLIYRLIDGVIVKRDNEDIIIGGSFTIDGVDDYYFEEEEKFEITETGLYKTRDGRQVYVSFVDYAYDYPVRGCISGSLDMYSWTREGIILKVKKSDNDIVAKWED